MPKTWVQLRVLCDQIGELAVYTAREALGLAVDIFLFCAMPLVKLRRMLGEAVYDFYRH